MTESDIEFWGSADLSGPLTHESQDEAIEMLLDAAFPEPCPREITICGWAKSVLSLATVQGRVDDAIVEIWERLDQDYCVEDDDTQPSPAGQAGIDLYAKMLAEAIHEHYPVLIYHPIKGSERKVDCVAWVKEHRQNWLRADNWRGFQPAEASDADAD